MLNAGLQPGASFRNGLNFCACCRSIQPRGVPDDAEAAAGPEHHDAEGGVRAKGGGGAQDLRKGHENGELVALSRFLFFLSRGWWSHLQQGLREA